MSESKVSCVFTKYIVDRNNGHSTAVLGLMARQKKSIQKTRPFCFNHIMTLTSPQLLTVLSRIHPIFWQKLALGHSINTIIQHKVFDWYYTTRHHQFYLKRMEQKGVWQVLLSIPALSKLLPCNVILADCGFNIYMYLIPWHWKVLPLIFQHSHKAVLWACLHLKWKPQEKANIRIHVERILGVVHQQFQILSATGALQNELVSHTTTRRVVLETIVSTC